MDRVQFVLVAAVLLVAVATNGVIAQMICNVPVSGLMGCRTAVTPPNPTVPSAACCSTISHADLDCLCTYKNMLSSFGVDPNLALQLPAKCKLPLHPKCI